MNGELKLLVEWSSPWEEFWSSLKPALSRSPRQLAGEARTGLFPYRGILVAWVFEAMLLVAAVAIPAKLAQMRPYAPPSKPTYDVIYYSGNELPQTEDRSGSQSGRTGLSGGREARHPTQRIRVARGRTLREQVVDAPNIKLPRQESEVANLLAYRPLMGPPPSEGLRAARVVSPLQRAVIPPAPDVASDSHLTLPALSQQVIPPAPSVPDREIANLRVPGANQVQVIPPPVSAPARMTDRRSQLTLPEANPIAPAPRLPSQDVTSRGPRFGNDAMRTSVVPPPVALGNSEVARAPADLTPTHVIPPPVQMSNAKQDNRTITGIHGHVNVVPPPVQVSDAQPGTRALPNVPSQNAVVPPAPSFKATGNTPGRGQGAQGNGFGGVMEIGTVAAPPNHGGGARGSGIVVSSNPGSKVGVPAHGNTGSLAMSPAGGKSPGLGGSGGGEGINRGTGQASGLTGTGTGAGKNDEGRGSDANMRAGLSPYPGPGGAGTGPRGNPNLPGVSVQGGSNVVNLPSFGDSGDPASGPGHSSVSSKDAGPGITVVATSRSGGAFNFYGVLKGDRVYSIYLDTALGTAVMQFADPASVNHEYAQELQAPQPIRATLPSGLPHSRLIIACVLDRTGLIRNARVLDTSNAVLTSKVLAALYQWKFRPVMRGNRPVEVNAILGFNVDTSDQF